MEEKKETVQIDKEQISQPKNNLKKIAIIIMLLGIIMIGVGFSYGKLLGQSDNKTEKEKNNTKSNQSITKSIDNTNNTINGDMVITKEERYVDDQLLESVTYNYNDKGIVEAESLLYDCKDYDHCTYMNPAAYGLYKYKYEVDGNGLLNKIIKIDLYSLEGYSLYLDDQLKAKQKYGYTEILMAGEDKSIEIKFKYDDSGRLVERTGYEGSKKKSTVTFTYDSNNNLIEQIFTYQKGTTYKNKYKYDSNNNITEFTVDYIIKGEDQILVDSGSDEGADEKGSLKLSYDYKYENDLISEIKIKSNLNNKFSDSYTIKREYDDNNNISVENVKYIDETNKLEITYKRKIYYEKRKFNSNNLEYEISKNRLQTHSDSIADYLYTEDNWLGIYHFEM